MTTSTLNEEMTTNPQVEKLLLGLRHLPGGSDTYNRILFELRDPAGTLEQVGHFVASDPAITTEVLKNANSAALGFSRIVTDPKDAAMLLGGEQVLAIVMMVDVFTLCEHTVCKGFSVADYFRHSRMVAWNAQALMRTVTNDREVLGAAFTSGLLHDIGKLLFAVNYPNEYRNCHDNKKETHRLGATHTELGAHFLASRELPTSVVNAVRKHDQLDAVGSGDLSLSDCLFIANLQEHHRSQTTPSAGKLSKQIALVGKRFGIRRLFEFALT